MQLVGVCTVHACIRLVRASSLLACFFKKSGSVDRVCALISVNHSFNDDIGALRRVWERRCSAQNKALPGGCGARRGEDRYDAALHGRKDLCNCTSKGARRSIVHRFREWRPALCTSRAMVPLFAVPIPVLTEISVHAHSRRSRYKRCNPSALPRVTRGVTLLHCQGLSVYTHVFADVSARLVLVLVNPVSA